MAAAAILDFKKFHFPLIFRMHTFFLRKNVKFGNDQSTESKVALSFRNFCFGLNFPFEGLFRAVFGGRRPPNGVPYNSNPQKAQLALEWRHMTHRPWKSADSCERTAWRRHPQTKKKGRTNSLYFTPFQGANQNEPIYENVQGAWSPRRNHVCQMPF